MNSILAIRPYRNILQGDIAQSGGIYCQGLASIAQSAVWPNNPKEGKLSWYRVGFLLQIVFDVSPIC